MGDSGKTGKNKVLENDKHFRWSHSFPQKNAASKITLYQYRKNEHTYIHTMKVDTCVYMHVFVVTHIVSNTMC